MQTVNKLTTYIKDVILISIKLLIVWVLIIELFHGTLGIFSSKLPKLVYISKIHTPKIGLKKVKKSLDKLNEMSYTNIVSYDIKFTPIEIYESDNLGDNTLGMAIPFITGCTIILNSNKLENTSRFKLETTIIHEFAHCAGEGHRFDPTDMMYPASNETMNYKNLINRLKEKLK